MKCCVVLLLFLPCFVWAKDTPKYPVSAIPSELKEKADVVYRKDISIFTIYSKNRATHSVLKVITILNQNGKEYADEVVGYDRLSKITSIRGSVYNAEGELIRKVKPSEVYDQAAFDGFSLYSDNRLKFINLSYGSYPYTVEIEYEVEYKYLFSIPGFNVVGEKVAVEESENTVVYATDLKPKYRTNNISEPPVITQLPNNMESMSWKFKNVQPIILEPYGGSLSEQVPSIIVVPSTFEYDGYVGTMNSWNEFGQWINGLNKGRNVLPEITQQKIKEITATLTTTEGKIKAVYEYMQNKTRYVSIQLGIGGFQPFEAKVVDQNGYGDCKALSNYMVSMLDVIGIKAHYVLVNAGRTSPTLQTGFPSSQFNHAIVCVPNGADTVWLECTSQTNPYGYMGSFTGNRKALAITDNGAEVVNTPVYGETHNVQSRSAVVKIDAAGNAKAQVKTVYAGTQYENDNLDNVLGNNYDDQQKWIRNNTEIPSFDIVSFSMIEKRDKLPSVTVNLNLALNRFCSVSGKRLFLTPNLMNRSTYIPEKVEKRKMNVRIRSAFSDFDTIRYEIPTEMYPEFLPPAQKISSRFGEYEINYKLDAGTVVYTRKLVMKRGVHPPEAYTDLIDFYKQISKADNVKMVFLNKT